MNPAGSSNDEINDHRQFLLELVQSIRHNKDIRAYASVLFQFPLQQMIAFQSYGPRDLPKKVPPKIGTFT